MSFLLKKAAPSDNLRLYISEAVLPPVGVVSKPGIDCLALFAGKAESFGIFEAVNVWNENHLKIACFQFLDEHFHGFNSGLAGADASSEALITIPSPLFFNVPDFPFARPTTLPRFADWVYHLPLQTALRVFHVAFPDYAQYDLVKASSHKDVLIWHFVDPNLSNNSTRNRKSCVFIFVPPWTLSDDEMRRFSLEQDFPAKKTYIGKQTSGHGKLWALVHNICHNIGTQHFILSSYTNWAFGSFSAGFTQSYVSPVFAAESHHPTVLQLMLFWMGSSAGVPGGFELPKFYEPVSYIAPECRPSELALQPPHNPYANAGDWLVPQPNNPDSYYPYKYSIGRDGRRNWWLVDRSASQNAGVTVV